MSTSKTILITGATAGIGRTTALHLARLGHHVIASGRKPAELTRLAAEAQGLAGKLDVVPLDVTQPSSIAAAMAEVDRLTGERGLDTLINNAGFGVLGPTSEISDAEIRRQYETNVFGLMNVIRAFLPAMRARRAGRIINVSSVGGRLTLPYFGVYNSTKYAVESLSDALRYELQPFGIDVVLIEPGLIRTHFAATVGAKLSTLGGDADPAGDAAAVYADFNDVIARGTVAAYERGPMARMAGEPLDVARTIARAIEAPRPRARYTVGPSATFFLTLRRWLGDAAWDWLLRSNFAAPKPPAPG